ncbi:MAG: hypothetical protein ACFNTU_06490 [Catonella sp.]
MEEERNTAELAFKRLKALEGITYAEWRYIQNAMEITFNDKARESAEGFTISSADIEKMKEYRLFRHRLNKNR